jgi:hypothetical protein
MSAHFEPTLLRWQVWSAVAYGVKGIAYWTLRPATDAFSGIGFGRGVFDEANRPTPLFPEIRRLNAELHALGPHLMALDSRGAWHARAQGQRHVESGRWDAAPDAGARDGVRGIATGPGRDDGLVSVYRNRKTGERWLGVFNKSLATSRTFRVQLDAAPSRIERIDSTDGRAVAVPVQGTVFSSGLLAPGGFALFRVPRAS